MIRIIRRDHFAVVRAKSVLHVTALILYLIILMFVMTLAVSLCCGDSSGQQKGQNPGKQCLCRPWPHYLSLLKVFAARRAVLAKSNPAAKKRARPRIDLFPNAKSLSY